MSYISVIWRHTHKPPPPLTITYPGLQIPCQAGRACPTLQGALPQTPLPPQTAHPPRPVSARTPSLRVKYEHVGLQGVILTKVTEGQGLLCSPWLTLRPTLVPCWTRMPGITTPLVLTRNRRSETTKRLSRGRVQCTSCNGRG